MVFWTERHINIFQNKLIGQNGCNLVFRENMKVVPFVALLHFLLLSSHGREQAVAPRHLSPLQFLSIEVSPLGVHSSSCQQLLLSSSWLNLELHFSCQTGNDYYCYDCVDPWFWAIGLWDNQWNCIKSLQYLATFFSIRVSCSTVCSRLSLFTLWSLWFDLCFLPFPPIYFLCQFQFIQKGVCGLTASFSSSSCNVFTTSFLSRSVKHAELNSFTLRVEYMESDKCAEFLQYCFMISPAPSTLYTTKNPKKIIFCRMF